MRPGARSPLSIAAALAAIGSIPAAEIDPRSLIVPRPASSREPRLPKHPRQRAQMRAYANNAKLIDNARRATAALNGNPPGYTYAHHDRLVRLCGAVRTRLLERRILKREITFAQAVGDASAP